jgi:hypothetical protein
MDGAHVHLPTNRPAVVHHHPRHTACHARRVDVNVVRPCLALQTTPGQAAPYSAGPQP